MGETRFLVIGGDGLIGAAAAPATFGRDPLRVE